MNEVLSQAEVDDMSFGYVSCGGIGELRELVRAVECKVIEMCNKAAEEGGRMRDEYKLPELNDSLMSSCVQALLQCSASEVEDYSPKLMDGYENDIRRVYAAIAADRASRHVASGKDASANKAEVERDAARYRWLRNPDTDVSLVLDKQTGFVEPMEGVPGSGGFHTYEYRAGDELDAAIDLAMCIATPPATTGCAEARHSGGANATPLGAMPKDLAIQCLNALDVDSEAHAALSKFIIEGGAVGASKESTLSSLTDERKRAMFEEWATKQGSYELSPYNWRVKSVRGVPYTGYVRPYKQDRTVYAFEGFIAALDEVAAQAGQVAVPEADLLQIDRELESIPALMDKNYKGCVREAIRNIQALLAKSSPAKESK